MTVRLDAGWDFARIGSAKMLVTEFTGSLAFQIICDSSGIQYATSAGGSVTVVDSDTSWCHTDLSSKLGTGQYDDFPGALKAALDAGSAALGNNLSYDVTWSDAQYSIVVDASDFAAFTFSTLSDAGTTMRRILGFSGDSSSAHGHLSDVTPYYTIEAAMPSKSNVKREYHQGGMVNQRVSNSGAHYGIGPQAFAKYYDFELWYESAAAVFSADATSAVPWTYEHFWEHVQASEPFVCVDSVASQNTVHYLTAQGADFDLARHQQDWDKWKIAFRTIYEGTL